MAIVDLDSLLNANPQLHRDGKGGLTSWSLPHDVLRFIDSKLKPGLDTLETGIGVSTLVFALGRTHHTAIAHHPDEVENVTRYCKEKSINTDDITRKIKACYLLFSITAFYVSFNRARMNNEN